MSPRTRMSGAAPLVVVSNRLPYNLPRPGAGKKPRRNVGGLVNALEPILARRGGSWVGWGGTAQPSVGAVHDSLTSPQSFDTPTGVRLDAVPLGERDLQSYYHGFSNRALWPLFHGFLDKTIFEPDHYQSYRQVNQRFAEIVARRAGPQGHVWVHDFHLMLVPYYLRQAGFSGRIDFFLHIPFPPSEIYRALPWREDLMTGVLASDSVAFHVDRYRDNFIATARYLARTRVRHQDGGALLVHDRGETSAIAAPIGVDVEEFERIAALDSVTARARRLRDSHRGCRILFGADRLDYTKGVRERLRTMERYLEVYPEQIGRIVFEQIVVPSRNQVEEYRLMKREIDAEVGRINGRFARDGWIPIHYRYLALGREELVAHYLAADVALVTPLRDGLNLVAAEFAASRIDGDGVLILSEFAGVAESAPGAIIVNPYNLDGCARALGEALAMTPDQRRRRMARLRRQVRANPVGNWAEACLRGGTRTSAAAAGVSGTATRPSPPSP